MQKLNVWADDSGGLGLKDIKTTECNGTQHVGSPFDESRCRQYARCGSTRTLIEGAKIDGAVESNGDEEFTEPVASVREITSH